MLNANQGDVRCGDDVRRPTARPGGLKRVSDRLSVGSAAANESQFYRSSSMKAFALKIQKFLKSEDGPTAVEYAVMLALIVVVCLTTIQSLGTNANATFQKVSTQLQTANS